MPLPCPRNFGVCFVLEGQRSRLVASHIWRRTSEIWGTQRSVWQFGNLNRGTLWLNLALGHPGLAEASEKLCRGEEKAQSPTVAIGRNASSCVSISLAICWTEW